MYKTKMSFLIIAISVFLLTPVCAENQKAPDAKGVSVEFRFVCEKPGPDCSKIINEDSKKELFLENQPQFTINDLGLARVVSTGITESEEPQDKRKSLILKGREGKPKPPAEFILYFTEKAKEKLKKVTSENIRRRLGVVIDGKLIMAPRILEPITEGEIKIVKLNATKEYAEDLVSRINAIAKMNPEQLENIFLTGLYYSRNGMYDDAINQFNKAIHVNPNCAEAYGNRATVYYYKKEYAKSWDDVHKAEGLGLTMHPDFLKKLKKASGREK